MKIFAHRGYSMKFPENTVIAFEKALEAKCDGIECDVQLTRDRVPVIIHDEKIDRCSDGRGYVKDYTYKELLDFDFAHYMPGHYGRQQIMTLSELLTLIKYSGREIILNLELKNSVIDYKDLEQIVLDETRDYEDDFEIIYSSFNHNSIRRFYKLRKDIKAAPLVNYELPDLPRYVKSLGACGVHPSILILDEDIIKSLLDQNIYVNVYTINDIDLAKRLEENKVSGIFTDCCLEMKEALRKMEKSLVLIKPDGVKRNIIGKIIAMYEEQGLVVEKLQRLTPTREQVEEHYKEHAAMSYYPGLIESLLSGDIVAMVISGEYAIGSVRNINGATDPDKATPGTIRALYGEELPNNTVHGSDSPESFEREYAIWFGDK